MRQHLALLGLFAACDGGGGNAIDAIDPIDAIDADPFAPDGGPTGRTVLGTIRVLEARRVFDHDGTPIENRWGSAIAYYTTDRPPRWHREVARAGDCVLLRYTPALCTPACAADLLCVDTDVCDPPTRFQPAGQLTSAGLRVPLTMDGPDGYYYAQDQLPEDVFTDDAIVTATLAGDDHRAHAITTRGVPPIVAAIELGQITLVPGQDQTVRWTPAAGGARVRVTLNSNNQGHGAPYYGIIDCDSDDGAGEVTIAAALVDGFPATRAWDSCAGSDCPPSTIRRYHRGAVDLGAGGEAELIVGSQLDFGVDHDLR